MCFYPHLYVPILLLRFVFFFFVDVRACPLSFLFSRVCVCESFCTFAVRTKCVATGQSVSQLVDRSVGRSVGRLVSQGPVSSLCVVN